MDYFPLKIPVEPQDLFARPCIDITTGKIFLHAYTENNEQETDHIKILTFFKEEFEAELKGFESDVKPYQVHWMRDLAEHLMLTYNEIQKAHKE